MKHALTLLTMIVFIVGCNSTATSPEVEFNGPSSSASVHVPTGSGNIPGWSADADVVTQCDTLNITARRVLSVQPGSVTLRVTATHEDAYVRLINADTGTTWGDYPSGDITLSLPAGEYRVFVFVEALLDGRVIQCDGSLSFTIPALPPPPPPPKKPECNEDNSSNEEDCTEPEPDCLCHIPIGHPASRSTKCEGNLLQAHSEHFEREIPDFWGTCEGAS